MISGVRVVSERRGPDLFDFWIAFITLSVLLVVLALWSDKNDRQIRDLQRRVGQLESERR